MFMSLSLTIIAFIPTMQKNKKLFGSYMLGTQRSFELLQGHSPVARGSWMHHWEEAGNPLYEYTHANIPGLDSLNEYEEANARKELAFQWAIHHPAKESVLTARKIVIYFLPYNFEQLPGIRALDMVTLMIHLLFFAGVAYAVFTHKLIKKICCCIFLLLLLCC
jgi:hypothetical protein